MNQAYTAALSAKDQVTPKEFQAISEHLINAQAGKIEAYVKNYSDLLGEHAWSPQMIMGLNQALEKAGVAIVEVEGGETKEASHSDFFQSKYISRFERSEEFLQLHQVLSELREQKGEIDAEDADLFGGELDDSVFGKLVANKLQNEVAKIVVYIEDLLCADKDMPLQEDTLRALDFALQINGHELRGINLAAHLDPSRDILFQILAEKKTTEAAPEYDARTDGDLQSTLRELKKLIRDCTLDDEPEIFNLELLDTYDFVDEITHPLFKTYLQSLTQLRENLTVAEVLERFERDIDLFNAQEIVKAIEMREENLSESAQKVLAANVQFNIKRLEPLFEGESDLAVAYQLKPVSEAVFGISLENPYQDVLEYVWSEVEILLAQMTLKNGLFDLEAFNRLGAEGPIYLLTYRFLSSIIATFGAARTIPSNLIERAAKAHYKKVFEEAKKQDQIHSEKIYQRKEEAVRAQRELQREEREAVRRQASQEAADEQKRRGWFDWLPSMPRFSLFS